MKGLTKALRPHKVIKGLIWPFMALRDPEGPYKALKGLFVMIESSYKLIMNNHEESIMMSLTIEL